MADIVVVLGYGGFVQLLVVTVVADQTGRVILLLVAGLIGVALALTALTVWYWRHTDPSRRQRSQWGAPPVEMLGPRPKPVVRVPDVGVRPPPPVRAATNAHRPGVASIPPTPVVDHGATEAHHIISRRWVDPDDWVEAFSSKRDGGPVIPKPVRPRAHTEHPQPNGPAEVEPAAMGAAPDSSEQPDRGLAQSAHPVPTSTGQALSDVDWNIATRVALSTLVEAGAPDTVDVRGEAPVRPSGQSPVR